jgi:hypothetical protein
MTLPGNLDHGVIRCCPRSGKDQGFGDSGQGATVLELPQQPEPVQVQHAVSDH